MRQILEVRGIGARPASAEILALGNLKDLYPGPQGLRAGRHADPTLEQGIGKWLEPHDLAEPRRLGRFNSGDVPLLGQAPAGRAARVEAPVGGADTDSHGLLSAVAMCS